MITSVEQAKEMTSALRRVSELLDTVQSLIDVGGYQRMEDILTHLRSMNEIVRAHGGDIIRHSEGKTGISLAAMRLSVAHMIQYTGDKTLTMFALTAPAENETFEERDALIREAFRDLMVTCAVYLDDILSSPNRSMIVGAPETA